MAHKESKMKNKLKFKRQNFLLKKLKDSWRRPRGIHSKLRLKKRGKGKRPKIGYGNDRKIRGLTKNQHYTYINNIKDLENIKNSIIISSNIGLKKKLGIITKAKELGLNILNMGNTDKFLEETKKKREEKIQKKKEGKTKVKVTKKDEAKETSKEEKEKSLKEEKRKVLEKGL